MSERITCVKCGKRAYALSNGWWLCWVHWLDSISPVSDGGEDRP